MAQSMEKQLEQLKERQIKDRNKIKELESKINAKKRKERNHLLFQAGGVIDEVLKKDAGRGLQKDDIANLRRFLYTQDKRGNFFINAMKTSIGTDEYGTPVTQEDISEMIDSVEHEDYSKFEDL